MATLYLLKDIELNNSYDNTLDFEDETAQLNYFLDKKFTQVTVGVDFSYLRENLSVTVEISKDNLFGCNYLMYCNEDSDKWYYAFITKKEYINEACTRLSIETDVMQTFMFDYEFIESFIDREHQDRWDEDDKPIYNLIPENLELGRSYNIKATKKYIAEDSVDSDSSSRLWYIIKAKEPLGKFAIGLGAGVVSTWNNTPYTSATGTQTTKQNNIDTGLYVYIVPAKPANRVYLNDLQHWMLGFNDAGALYEDPNVVSVTPVRYIKSISYTNVGGNINNVMFKNTEVSPSVYSTEFQVATYGDPTNQDHMMYIRNYDPNEFAIEYSETIEPSLDITARKNIANETKLLTSPYNFIRLNYGNEFQNYSREFFSNGVKFDILTSLGYNGNINIFPKNYNNADRDIFSVMQQKNILNISLRTDKWQEYLLQNKASLNGGLVVKGIQTALTASLGLATGGIGLAVAGTRGLSYGAGVANELIKRENIKAEPDDIRPNVDDTEMVNIINDICVRLDILEIKPEFRQRIYEYFYHFGYKCNEFKVPNLKSRYYFNYIKTIGCDLKSNVDDQYIRQIKAIFDNGITIWHYRDSQTFKGIGNYEYENVEMSKIGE